MIKCFNVVCALKDRATAERIANSVLNDPKNIKKIENWIDDPKKPKLMLRYKGDGEIIGRSVSRNSELVENVTNAKIILKKDNNGNSYRISNQIEREEVSWMKVMIS
ncbi:RNase A-like domain-containing protein [Bacillus subtilis]